MNKVTAKEIIEEVQSRIISMENANLDESLGALNGIDMEVYSRGYLDALGQLKLFFETRV